MKYVKWFLLAILDVLFNIIAYITNPIVVLAASEYGNLPWLLTWWDNYDDCMDVEWFIKEGHVPSWAVYDYDKHYRFHDSSEGLRTRGIAKSYVDILDWHFTLKERLQRYVCRVLWLYRNCAYGFSYYVTGIDVRRDDIVKIKTEEQDGYIYYVTDYAWVYKDERPSFFGLRWDNFVGWKMQAVTEDVERCMLAFRITPFDKKE